jgi:hypothetical protein
MICLLFVYLNCLFYGFHDFLLQTLPTFPQIRASSMPLKVLLEWYSKQHSPALHARMPY